MLPVPTFVVMVKRKPFTDECDLFAMGRGCSVEDVLLEAAYRSKLPVARFAEAMAIIDGEVIPKERWVSVRPHPGQTLIVSIIPGLPALPLVFAVAAAAAPTALGLAAGSFAAIAVSAGISIVGALIMMAISPVPRQSNSAPDKKENAVNSIQGVGNEARPYGPIPRLFGHLVNYFPPLATNYYTELSRNNHQYLRVVFCFGYGPVRISDIKIGTTPIENFEGVTMEFNAGYDTDEPLSLFPAQVREQSLSIELRQTNGWSQRRTEIDTDEASLDVIFPSGLQRIGAQKAKFNLEVEFEVQYKLSSASSWTAASLESDGKSLTMSGPGRFAIRGNTKVALRRTVRVELPARGRYDIQIRRLTTDDQSTSEGKNQTITVEQSYWTVLRSHRNEHPINKTGLALLALRMRSSDQLNGLVDRLNATVDPLIPVWNGSTWTNRVTQNPAWAYCEVLRGAANDRAVADDRINLVKMLELATYCTDEDITFDGALEDQASVYDRLQDIAGTANSSVSRSSGPFSVVIDNERDTTIQHFTEVNSWDFSSTKILSRRPHAVKVRFPNIRTLRMWDEIYVYDSGYDASNATLFETIELPYTSYANQAYRRARRALYMARLRPEIYSITVDAEHIVATPGDLVRVVHSVMLAGIGAARVASLDTSGADTLGVTLDAPFPMAGGTSYALRFRLANGDSLLVPVDTVAGSSADFTFTTAVTTVDGPAAGDLALFGESGAESIEMIVRSVEPTSDLVARITLVDYSPEIFTSAHGPIPEFDPQITIPPIVNRGIPPAPSVTSIASDETVLIRASDGTLTSRILIGITVDLTTAEVPVDDFQVRYRPADTDQDFDYLGSVPGSAGSASVMPVDDGVTYDIEIRSRFAGQPSAWTIISHTVIGKTTPPPDVEMLYRQGDFITWPYADAPLDHAGFLVRANFGTADSWGTGQILHQGFLTTASLDISSWHSTMTFMVKAVDTSGIEAETAATLTINLGDLLVANNVDTQSEAPGFTGTITGGTVGGGVLQADLLASPAFWPADGDPFWPADGDPFWPTSTYDELTYTVRWSPASDVLNDGILRIDTTVTGTYVIEYREATSAPFWPADGDPFWPADGDPFWAAETIGEYTPWTGKLGPFDTTARAYDFRVTVRGGSVQGEITQFDLIVDVPDIVEHFDDFVSAATTGTRLTLTKTYRAIDNISITRQDDGVSTAIEVAWIDKQANPGAAGGPLIRGFDLAHAVVQANSDITVQGH